MKLIHDQRYFRIAPFESNKTPLIENKKCTKLMYVENSSLVFYVMGDDSGLLDQTIDHLKIKK
jgi:hypothetical protein